MNDLLTALQRDGIAVTPAVDLIGPDLWTELQAAAARQIAQQQRLIALMRTGRLQRLDRRRAVEKRYLVRLIGDRPVYDPTSIWVQAAEAPALVDLARAYFPKPPILKAFDLWYTLPSTTSPRDSQLWHRDEDDTTILKLFVYLTDVTPDAGPLTYVPGTHRGQGTITPTIGYDYARIPRSTDDWMRAAAPEDTWRVLTGPVGTAVLADTTGWHKGGHGTVDRVLFTALYTTDPDPKKAYFHA